jgi:hypothetical protein
MTVCMYDIEESDDVRIVHLLEERDLANSGTRNPFIFSFETYLLECDNSTRM